MSFFVKAIPFYLYGNSIGVAPVERETLLKDILGLNEEDEPSDELFEFYKDRVEIFNRTFEQLENDELIIEKLFSSFDQTDPSLLEKIEERSSQVQMFLSGLERSGSTDFTDNLFEDAIENLDQHLEELGDMIIALEEDSNILNSDDDFLSDLANVWNETPVVWSDSIDIILSRLSFWKDKLK